MTLNPEKVATKPRLGRPIVDEALPSWERAPQFYEYLNNGLEGRTDKEIENIRRVYGTVMRYLRRNPNSLISVLNVRCRGCWSDWRLVVEALIADGVIVRDPVVSDRKGGGTKTSLLLHVAEDFLGDEEESGE